MHGEDRLDETELVERAKAGDLDAFERLVVLHQRAALQVAYVIAGSEAEDATQEAFVKAFRALGGFRSSSPSSSAASGGSDFRLLGLGGLGGAVLGATAGRRLKRRCSRA